VLSVQGLLLSGVDRRPLGRAGGGRRLCAVTRLGHQLVYRDVLLLNVLLQLSLNLLPSRAPASEPIQAHPPCVILSLYPGRAKLGWNAVNANLDWEPFSRVLTWDPSLQNQGSDLFLAKPSSLLDSFE
jgi:hypothetical protein